MHHERLAGQRHQRLRPVGAETYSPSCRGHDRRRTHSTSSGLHVVYTWSCGDCDSAKTTGQHDAGPDMTKAPEYTGARVMVWITSAGEHLVEKGFGLVFVGVLGQRQLRDEDLASLGQHALLPCRESAVLLPPPDRKSVV